MVTLGAASELDALGAEKLVALLTTDGGRPADNCDPRGAAENVSLVTASQHNALSKSASE